MNHTRFVPCGLAVIALIVASTASWASTWQWRDAQGRMVYSDRPPPVDVRPSQIVRAPSTAERGAAASPSAGAPSTASSRVSPVATKDASEGEATAKVSAGSAKAPKTWVEREREFRERQAEREAQAARAREDGEQAAAAKRACEDAQREIRTLESGLRVVSVNARGEAETLDDAQRAQRLTKAHADLARLCAEDRASR
jgi:hypothetical protein